MTGWNYLSIDLNNLPRKRKELDLLNDAGAEGWELVAINGLNIATLKRPRASDKPGRLASAGGGQLMQKG